MNTIWEAEKKKNKQYPAALVHFQKVSVFGFFVLSTDELCNCYKALAMTYRDMNNKQLAIHWAEEVYKLKVTPENKTLLDNIKAKFLVTKE